MHFDPHYLYLWQQDDGDNTHILDHDLNESSTVIDFGGFKGIWAQKIIDKFNPNLYILEPVPEFYEVLVSKFSDNEKVHLLNSGISTENKQSEIYVHGDASSTHFKHGQSMSCEFNTLDEILNAWNIDGADLLQINIEGDEYSLLDSMIASGSIHKFKNIQVQFHLGVENDIARRDEIHAGFLKNGFQLKYDYRFVWECWTTVS